ncbi:MAG: hypothetical protein N3E36_01655 [Sulfolobales archaeon]|nr:hypothetical protein [Sulfolobales archaeon]MCX8198720.1 hypothetical protein [Sulfolobales archaeon]MDW8169793.1 hypothetical protein [Desulfurococcaceae archaeon]
MLDNTALQLHSLKPQGSVSRGLSTPKDESNAPGLRRKVGLWISSSKLMNCLRGDPQAFKDGGRLTICRLRGIVASYWWL